MELGGRVTGVDVAGLTLGGSVSIVTEGGCFYVSATFPRCPWLTNQYGLTIVTATAYELVLPTGAFVNITQYSNPSFFFVLMGGYNNFGCRDYPSRHLAYRISEHHHKV